MSAQRDIRPRIICPDDNFARIQNAIRRRRVRNEHLPPPAARIEGLDGVRAAAVRLAVKCMGQLPARPNMRQAAQEIRLLCLHARRMEAREGKAAAVPARAEAQPEKAEGERWMRVVREEVA